MTIYNYITMFSAALLIILILMQTRGASLGAGLGGGGSAEVNTVRRGSDKTIHQITIILVFVFAASLILHVAI